MNPAGGGILPAHIASPLMRQSYKYYQGRAGDEEGKAPWVQADIEVLKEARRRVWAHTVRADIEMDMVILVSAYIGKGTSSGIELRWSVLYGSKYG